MAHTQNLSLIERATITLTGREKHALRFLAGHRGTTESELLRERLIADLVLEYDDIMARLELVRDDV